MIYFIEFINKVGPLCRQLYSLRSDFLSQSTINFYEVFKKIDSTMKGFISTDDLIETLGLPQKFGKLVMEKFSKVLGALKLTQFKQLLQLQDFDLQLSNKLKESQVMLIVRKIMEYECEYILKAEELRKQLRKLDVQTIQEIFKQFDSKNVHYIDAKDIKTFLQNQNQTVPQYLDLVIKKQFRYQLIGSQQFHQFFQKSSKRGSIKRGEIDNVFPQEQKRVTFEVKDSKSPKRIFCTSKKSKRSGSKSSSKTPHKFRTISPKRYQQSTLDHEQNTLRLLKLFNPSDTVKSMKRTYHRYFKLYSIYQ